MINNSTVQRRVCECGLEGGSVGAKALRTTCGSAFCKGFLNAWTPGRKGEQSGGRKEGIAGAGFVGG